MVARRDTNHFFIVPDFPIDHFVACAPLQIFLHEEVSLRPVAVVHEAVPIVEEEGVLQVAHLVLILVLKLVYCVQLCRRVLQVLSDHFLEDLEAGRLRLLTHVNSLAWAVQVNTDGQVALLGAFVSG